MHCPGVFFLAGFNAKGKMVLPWRQWAGGKVCESAGRTVSLVEIKHDFSR
jgi:hypothetical protein